MFNLGNYQTKRRKEFLYDKYPRFLENCYVSVGEGWISIVEQLCQKIENVYQNLSPEEKAEADKVGAYKGWQVKEKFGTLRFYATSDSGDIAKWIDETEDASEKICESCGAEGKLRTGGWLKTLCNACELQRKVSKWVKAKDIDLQLLKDNHVRLYYFGLGFIQLKNRRSF